MREHRQSHGHYVHEGVHALLPQRLEALLVVWGASHTDLEGKQLYDSRVGA
jgi:hypothetical protein